jgi:hypothetical protein
MGVGSRKRFHFLRDALAEIERQEREVQEGYAHRTIIGIEVDDDLPCTMRKEKT